MKKSICLFLAAVMLLCALPFSAYAAAPAKVTKLTASTGGQDNQIVLSWQASQGADGYVVSRSESGKKDTYKKIATITETRYKDTNLKSSKAYYYKVKAFRAGQSKTEYSQAAKINLSTRITDYYASNRFAKTYKAMRKLFTNSHSKDANGKYITKGDYTYIRYRVTKKEFNSKKKVINYLKKYFTTNAANRIFKEHFVVKDKKLYVDLLLYGYDTALVINDIPVTSMSYTNKKVKTTFGLMWTLPDSNFERSTTNQQLVYQRGKWVFAYNSFWAGDFYAYESVITPGDGA